MGATEVLIVEDDETTRETVADLLQEEGYTVSLAPDGKSALAHLRAHPEGLVVVLDLMMPGIDGLAVLQAVAAEPPLGMSHVFILMTASRKTLPLEVVELLHRLHVTPLAKPFELESLLAAVNKAASRLHQNIP